MTRCRIRITRQDFDVLMSHLYPGDRDEHGAVLLGGYAKDGDGQSWVFIGEVHLAKEGVDYVPGKHGYRALTPQFIHRCITRARDERLVYLAVHNHDSDREVDFSSIDLASHERGYPALLQIAKGMPVGAMVFGRRSAQADLWLPDESRQELERLDVMGVTMQRLEPRQHRATASMPQFDRQVRWFGAKGQSELARARVAVVGLGGVGSIVAELLGRLGVGHFLLVDPDAIDETNLSRVVGSNAKDVEDTTLKVDIAKRGIREFNPDADVEVLAKDASLESVALKLAFCDYIFLAADSMRARLVINALVQQYLVPGVQLGSKVSANSDGGIAQVFSVIRPMRPRPGCLWCNELIDPYQLAQEAKSEAQRKAEAYGTEEPNPSVITLNAVGASHAVNDFLLDYLGIRPEPEELWYDQFQMLNRKHSEVLPRVEPQCPECSREHGRFARAGGRDLPTTD